MLRTKLDRETAEATLAAIHHGILTAGPRRGHQAVQSQGDRTAEASCLRCRRQVHACRRHPPYIGKMEITAEAEGSTAVYSPCTRKLHRNPSSQAASGRRASSSSRTSARIAPARRLSAGRIGIPEPVRKLRMRNISRHAGWNAAPRQPGDRHAERLRKQRPSIWPPFVPIRAAGMSMKTAPANFSVFFAKKGRVQDFVSEVYRHKTASVSGSPKTPGSYAMREGKPLFIEGTIQDATERIEAQSAMERVASIDALTGACSRFQFMRRLKALTEAEDSELRALLHRSRQVQGSERSLRSWRRRCSAEGRDRKAFGPGERRRGGGQAGRRRIRNPHRSYGQRRQSRIAGSQDPARAIRSHSA